MGRRGGGRKDCIDMGGWVWGGEVHNGRKGGVWEGMDTDRSRVIPGFGTAVDFCSTGGHLALRKPHI